MQTPKYHILFLSAWYPNPDDIQLGIFIKKHAKAVSLFCKVTVVYVRGIHGIEKPMLQQINQSENYNEQLIFFKTSKWPGINRFWLHYYYRQMCRELVKIHGKPDLIHLNVMYGMAGICEMFSKHLKVPYLVTEHWHGFTNGRFRLLKKSLQKHFFNLAVNSKIITCVSGFLEKHVRDIFSIQRTVVIPNVVEALEPSETERMEQTIIFLTAADLIDDIKNISSVIKVIQEIVEQPGLPNFEYHIIGSGPDEKKLQMLAKENAVAANRIIFHSRQSNEYVLNYLQKATCAIINSETETFSVFAAEAVLCGKPVISTRCGGPEDFLNNDNAILISAHNKNELKNAIITVLNNEANFDSEKIKTSLGNRFSSETIGYNFYNLYQQILGAK